MHALSDLAERDPASQAMDREGGEEGPQSTQRKSAARHRNCTPFSMLNKSPAETTLILR
jgi:hypothetical protein